MQIKLNFPIPKCGPNRFAQDRDGGYGAAIPGRRTFGQKYRNVETDTHRETAEKSANYEQDPGIERTDGQEHEQTGRDLRQVLDYVDCETTYEGEYKAIFLMKVSDISKNVFY